MSEVLSAVVSGGSMYPLLHNGDRVIAIPNQFLSLGDVVIFKSEGFVRTHRIVRINKDQIWTKGDNVPHCDLPIGKEHVQGVVKMVIKAKTNQVIKLSNLKNSWRVVWYARLELLLIRLCNFFSKTETEHYVKQKLHRIYYRYVVKEFNFEQ